MPHFDDSCYKTRSAVLFIIFNRPDTTNRVFSEIRKARPRRLYIAADAPRKERPQEIQLCEQTRSIVKKIDWDCEVKTLFQEDNLGCRASVPTAIDWFFKQEEEGIILEDDCLPANSFFKFCDVMLEKYRNDTRVWHISGCNLQEGKQWGDGSYYFSNRAHVWGWANWRRVWSAYNQKLDNYDNKQVEAKLLNIYPDPLIVKAWKNIYNQLKSGSINSWAYYLDFILFFNNGLNIIPNVNLISNLGYGDDSTNTKDKNHRFANVPLKEISVINHPQFILPEKKSRYFYY